MSDHMEKLLSDLPMDLKKDLTFEQFKLLVLF